MRISICVPRETHRDCYERTVPNVYQALMAKFGDRTDIRSAEIGIRHGEHDHIEITARRTGDRDALKCILNSVVTTLGRQYSGKVRNEDTGWTYEDRVFAHA